MKKTTNKQQKKQNIATVKQSTKAISILDLIAEDGIHEVKEKDIRYCMRVISSLCYNAHGEVIYAEIG